MFRVEKTFVANRTVCHWRGSCAIAMVVRPIVTGQCYKRALLPGDWELMITLLYCACLIDMHLHHLQIDRFVHSVALIQSFSFEGLA